VNVVVVGFSALEQLDEAAAASHGARLTQADQAQIDALFHSDFGLRQPI
jgi:aryl-alcohol dehydrogenase-like predicted oxidoreductase